mmetsp:Transcript_35036/g.84790  ORF Transcript_35036/g.84790 Transcript_35036/m.84790 type:complete len:263 (+) Transcript_35036:5706-6494(+)
MTTSTSHEENDDDDDDDDDDEFGHMCRGRIGPGSWHCYVGVFDGKDSTIRIDGIVEQTVWDTVSPLADGSIAILDGLTIGSDHSFDMSLCFGNGSDGEGEGAIAELAMFKGRMELADIERIETHMMNKYGLARPPDDVSGKEVTQDYEYTRRAHALLAKSYAPKEQQQQQQQPSTPRALLYKRDSSTNMDMDVDVGQDEEDNNNNTDMEATATATTGNIPLKYMTKLRQVAWQQSSAVTGQKFSVERIGAKNTNAFSSDSSW